MSRPGESFVKINRFGMVIAALLILIFTISCFRLSVRGPLKFAPETLPGAQLGVPYEAKVTISQNVTPAGEFSLSEGSLPKGLALEKVEGEDAARIYGIPEETGAFKFKVFVWCYGTNVSGQTGEQGYTIEVR